MPPPNAEQYARQKKRRLATEYATRRALVQPHVTFAIPKKKSLSSTRLLNKYFRHLEGDKEHKGLLSVNSYRVTAPTVKPPKSKTKKAVAAYRKKITASTQQFEKLQQEYGVTLPGFKYAYIPSRVDPKKLAKLEKLEKQAASRKKGARKPKIDPQEFLIKPKIRYRKERPTAVDFPHVTETRYLFDPVKFAKGGEVRLAEVNKGLDALAGAQSIGVATINGMETYNQADPGGVHGFLRRLTNKYAKTYKIWLVGLVGYDARKQSSIDDFRAKEDIYRERSVLSKAAGIKKKKKKKHPNQFTKKYNKNTREGFDI